MDYSSLQDDPEHPTESSPWSTSPRVTRSGFLPQSGSDLQSSDTSGGAFTSSEQDLRQSQSSLTDHEVSSPEASARFPSAKDFLPENGETASTPNFERRAEYGAPGYGGQPQPYQARPELAGGPNRYSSAGRPVSRGAAPQYKLQAKITGLERTGRKDLILRFDVHVLCDP